MIPRIALIAGPTAVGKSSVALQIAERLGAEIISIDSVQLYRGLDIGSAKPTQEDRARVPHHLIDVLDPDEDCNVADFTSMAMEAIRDVCGRGKIPVAVGGTNLYVRILVHGIFQAPPPDAAIRARHTERASDVGTQVLHDELREIDPELASRVHPNDLVRISRGLEVYELTGKPLSLHQREHAFQTPNVDALKIGLNRRREDLYERINTRVDAMIAAGLVDEVRALVARGYDLGLKPLQSLGYRHAGAIISEDVTSEDAIARLKRDTRRFARQQLSWLRSERGVNWGEVGTFELDELVADIERFVGGDEPNLRWASPAAANL